MHSLLLRNLAALCATLALAACASTGGASDPQGEEMAAIPIPPNAPLHAFLERMVGDWEIANQVESPDGQVMVMEATESVSALGPWIVSEMVVAHGEGDFRARLQVTFDEESGKFVGTWADSSSSFLWMYEGTLEGDTLTLEAEGPSYEDMTVDTRYRDIVTIVSDDRREHRSEMLMKDGTWAEMVSGVSTRVD